MQPQSLFRGVFLAFALALAAGCAAPVPTGAWREDPGVRQLFASGQILPGHTY